MLIPHLKMARQVFFVECVIVNFYFGEGSEVVRHEHDGDVDVLELPHGVVHAPHEDTEQRIIAAKQLPLGVLHFEPLGFCFG